MGEPRKNSTKINSSRRLCLLSKEMEEAANKFLQKLEELEQQLPLVED
jgi:hypothetical protein